MLGELMGAIEPWHLIVILVVVLLVLGPKRLPEVGRSLGETIREFRKSTGETQDLVTGAVPSAAPAAPAPPAPVTAISASMPAALTAPRPDCPVTTPAAPGVAPAAAGAQPPDASAPTPGSPG
jgi:sec-independent protein translocase protein TatA